MVIAGGGPTGMMLAAELALAGVDAVIVERRAGPELESSRAGGLQARTIEVLDQRGVGERFVSEGKPLQTIHFPTVLDISDFPTRRPYGLGLWQRRFEEILAGWVDELDVQVRRESEVTGFRQDAEGVDVELADGGSLRAEYLVGCDGGRSVVRRAAGIEFAGWDAASSSLIAEAMVRDESEMGNLHRDDKGTYAMGPVGDGYARIVVRDEDLTQSAAEPTLADLSAGMIAAWGTRLRCARRPVDLAVQRCRAPGGVLPGGTRAAGRRRGSRAHAHGRTGSEHRGPGRGQPGLEAGPGGAGHLA